MFQLTVLYPEPLDRQAFERHYREVHLPLCAKLPGALEITYQLGIADPGDGPYFGLFQARFPDLETLEAALASPAGQAVEADVPNYATGGATVFVTALTELTPL